MTTRTVWIARDNAAIIDRLRVERDDLLRYMKKAIDLLAEAVEQRDALLRIVGTIPELERLTGWEYCESAPTHARKSIEKKSDLHRAMGETLASVGLFPKDLVAFDSKRIAATQRAWREFYEKAGSLTDTLLNAEEGE